MLRVFLLLLSCAITSMGSAQSAHETSDHLLDEVVVTGVRAGPSLWRVMKGDHTLWILGVVDPLPDQLQWQSHEVEQVLANSQAVLLDEPSISADASLFGKIGLYMQWRRMQKNADGKTLQEILPAELYARFTTLKQRHAKSKDLDELRPLIAAGELYRAALGKLGLTSRGAISRTVDKLARQHGLKPTKVRIKISEPRELLNSLNRIPLDAEIRCMAATLANLESDLTTVRQRANAWALGDVQTLRTLVSSDNRSACWEVLTLVPRVEQLTADAEQEWFAAADASLSKHRGTLALRGIRDVLKSGGVLEQFRAQGYEVLGP